MSKKFWLPTQKGTEVDPQVMKPPPKLVVPQAGGDPDLRAHMISAYQGRLGQFHMKQMQAYSLSTVPNMRTRMVSGDARFTYTNLQGQETIVLEVTPERLKRFKKPPIWYDFCLIEIKVPNMTEGNLFGQAYLTTPILEPITTTSTVPHPGFSHYAPGASQPHDLMLNCPQLPMVKELTAENYDQYASVLVDLRPARGLSAVTVDLHPYYAIPEVLPLGSQYYITSFTDVDAPPPVTPFPDDLLLANGPFPINETVSSPPPIIGPIGFTEAVIDDATFTWVYVLTGTTDTGWVFIGEADSGSGPFWVWTYFRCFTLAESGQRAGPDSQPCEVRAVLFKSDPGLVSARYTLPDVSGSYRRWEFADAALAPAPVDTVKLADSAVLNDLDVNLSLFDRFNVGKMGTVIVDQINWSVSFQQA